MTPRKPMFALVSVSVLFVASLASADGELPADPSADPSASAEPTVEAEPEIAPEEEEYNEEEDYEGYEGEDFCGGGESTPVDLAYYEMEEGRIQRARRMITEALRTGQVDEYQRPYALALLAETQLRLGNYGSAVVNYRKSLTIDSDSNPASRVGLATALFMVGARNRADREATTARDLVCPDQYNYVACYGAHAILAQTSSDSAARDTATQALQQIRTAHPEGEEQYNAMDRRLNRRARRAARGDRS
jgi:tetratricopeptide (TPR) repeat protein